MQSSSSQTAFIELLRSHQAYLRLAFVTAGCFVLYGTVCLVTSVTLNRSRYPWYVLLCSPVLSSAVKKIVNKVGIGSPLGLIIAGGLTNIWNVLFFVVATISITE